jgi:hypothetical protein
VKRQGNVWTVFWLIWNCSDGIHPSRSDKHRYKEILHRLCNSIRRKRPEFWHTKNWLLLHDNSPAHCSVLVQEELAKQQVTVLPHPPYSLDLAPCDFYFFPWLKKKATWALILVGRGDCHCHKGSCTRPSWKYLSAAFPAAIPTLADLHSGQQQLLWGRMWICVHVCEYLVIWCNKTTVHEIIDCSSISYIRETVKKGQYDVLNTARKSA